jgi:uncharacterized protein YkwD
VTAPRRRGGALLAALAAGALLVAVALAGPARDLGARLDALATPAATPAAPQARQAPPSSGPATPAAPASPSAAPSTHPSPRPAPPPTPARRPTTRAAAPSLLTAAEQRVVTLTNAQRARAGCGALRVDARLVAAARGHSADMAVRGYFEHDSPDGRTFVDRGTAAGYPDPGGENIAMGQQGADEVMTDWMGSEGHRANILDCSFTAIGVGLDTRGMYWTQDFGR